LGGLGQNNGRRFHNSKRSKGSRWKPKARAGGKKIWRKGWYHRPDKTENILALAETQCQWLREIGFADVDCFFKLFQLALFGGKTSY
jgi:hypothetical protein